MRDFTEQEILGRLLAALYLSIVVLGAVICPSSSRAQDIVREPGDTLRAIQSPDARGNTLQSLCLQPDGAESGLPADFAVCVDSSIEGETVTLPIAGTVTCGPDQFYRGITVADTDEGTPIVSDPSVERLRVSLPPCKPDPPTLLSD